MLASGAAALAWVCVVPTTADAQKPVASAAPSLVIEGATVVDVEQGRLVPDQRVVIIGNRIQAVGATGVVQAPTGARVVDARGKYLIPGLWDMHVHIALNWGTFTPRYAWYIVNGVTGIREAGKTEPPFDTLVQWRRDVAAGTRVGPRMIFAGQIDPDVTDISEALKLVHRFNAAKVDFIKTYALLRPVFFAVAAEARRLGLPFGGHIEGKIHLDEGNRFIRDLNADRESFFAAAAEARRRGIPFVGNWEGKHTRDEVAPQEASDSGISIIDHLHSEELTRRCVGPEATDEECRPLAERFQHNHTWVVPTLYAYGIMRKPGDGIADSLGLLHVAHRVGLPILAGSDTPAAGAGSGLQAELANLVAEGLTPLEALRSATLNPAQYLRGTDSLGNVTAGRLADLVLLDADPLADITNTTAIDAVVFSGRYFDRAELDRLTSEARAAEAEGR